MDRRTLRRTLVILPALCLLGCQHQRDLTSKLAEIDFPVIDAHAHWDDSPGAHPSTALEQEYAESGVVAAVIHAGQKEPNALNIRKSERQYVVCAAVVPGISVIDLEKQLRERKYQCLKIYLGYVPRYAADAFYRPFYRLAERFKLPVVFHTGDTYDKMAKVKYADPLGVDEIAVEYPKVTFVLAHVGNPWFQSAAEVIYKNDNVYADLSALLLEDLSKESEEELQELLIKPIRWIFLYVENPRKLMFGTDYPLVKVKPYLQAVRRAIPREAWRDVFHDNAVRVFGFKRPLLNGREK